MGDKQTPVFRALKPQGLKNGAFNPGVSRALPKKSFVKKVQTQQPTILGTKATQIDGKFPLEQNDEHLTDIKVVQQRSSVHVGNVPVSRPTNVFNQERITQHPVYGRSQLHLEARAPGQRFPVKKENLNTKDGMNRMRKQQASVNPYDVETQPGLANGIKYPTARLNQNMKKMQRQSNPYVQLNNDPTGRHFERKGFEYTRKDDGIWRETPFAVDGRMFEQQAVKQPQIDQRTQKRLQQQNAWLARRKEERNRLENMRQQMLAIRA